MKKGFTLLEVLLATIILGVGLAGILTALAQAQRMMMTVPDLETAQEIMDLGEMVYPLYLVEDESDIDTGEIRATDLWRDLTEERMSDVQEEKYHGFTWERELVDDHMSEDDLKHFNNLLRVRITVRWGERGRGRGRKQEESYVTLWRKPK